MEKRNLQIAIGFWAFWAFVVVIYCGCVIWSSFDPSGWLGWVIALDFTLACLPMLLYWFRRPIQTSLGGSDEEPVGGPIVWWVLAVGWALGLYHSVLAVWWFGFNQPRDGIFVSLPYVLSISFYFVWKLDEISLDKYIDRGETSQVTPHRADLPQDPS